MNNDYDYILDFVIPVGPTGPIGPTGPSSLISIISMHYSDATVSGILTILSNPQNLILPVGSNIFTLNNNNIVLNESGYYEFTIYGLLRDSVSSQKSSLVLKLDNNNLLTVNLSDETSELYFSRTTVVQCSSSQVVTIEFNKQDSSDASVTGVYLLIKKLYF